MVAEPLAEAEINKLLGLNVLIKKMLENYFLNSETS